MESYRELRDRQQKEVNEFPLGFAFSNQQFKEMMENWGLTEDDTDKIYSIGAGGYVQRKDSPAMHEMFNRHHKELQDAINEDRTGEVFIKQMFKEELENHEFGYTGDYEDTLDALGMTWETIRKNEALRHGLEIAAKEVVG